MFQWKRIDSLRVAVCLILFLFIPAAGLAAETALCGEWVFADLPGKTVIRLNEDGSAFYGGQNLTWDDTEEGLLLTDAEGASVAFSPVIILSITKTITYCFSTAIFFRTLGFIIGLRMTDTCI